MQVYYALAAELQVFDRSKPAAKKNYKQMLGDICKIKYSRFFIRNTGTTVAFIPSNRWERTKNGNSEQFIEPVLEEILGNNDCVAILSKEIPSTPREKVSWVCSADMYSVAELKSRLFNSKISTEDHEWISRLSRSLFRTFGTDINITHRISKALIQYKSLFRSAQKLFRKWNLKELYIVSSYGKGPFIDAAKGLGIPVIEIQHGIISKYHLGYSFPNSKLPPYLFPDKFLSWGEPWTPKRCIPLDQGKINNINRKNSSTSNTDSRTKEDMVVIISQWAISDKIAELVEKNLPKLKGMRIIYKPHPAESTVEDPSSAVGRLLNHKQVELATGEPLSEIQQRAKVQIGVFSTAILDGLEYGCETILLDLPGVEYMAHIIEQGKAELWS